jgi:hypothetical protein
MPETTFVGIKPVLDGFIVHHDFLFFTLCKDDAIIIILIALSIMRGDGSAQLA